MLSRDSFGCSDIGPNVTNTSLVDLRNKFIPKIHRFKRILVHMGAHEALSSLVQDPPHHAFCFVLRGEISRGMSVINGATPSS